MPPVRVRITAAGCRVGWCLRSLSGLAAASRTEDRYGVVLLCAPNLADIVSSLLSLILVLQQYIKYTVSWGRRAVWGSGCVRMCICVRYVRVAWLLGWLWCV